MDVAPDTVADCEAMGSVDSGTLERFIIALPCRDDAWLSVPLNEAPALEEWR